jgi:glutamate carboxypeptidase
METPTTEALLEGIRQWVEIESHTGDVAGVNRLMDRVEARYRRAGAHVERIAGQDGRGDHVLATSPWGRKAGGQTPGGQTAGGEGPGVLVLCHLDTVHPTGTIEHFGFREDGDKAYGPGIYDMKGGAYLALAAYESLAATQLAGRGGGTAALPVRLLYTSDEEVGSPTSRALIERLGANAKYVLVTEPAREGGKIVTGRRGTGRYVIRAHGRASHSGTRPQDGRSAIREIAHQILAIDALNDPATGVNTNVGLISGGTAANVVPEHCAIEVDLRMKTLADAHHLVARLEGLKPFDPDVTLHIEGNLNRPPFEKTVESANLLGVAKGIAAEIGFDLIDMYAGGGSDGNFLAHNRPVLDGLGVDGAGAHTLQEHLLISSLVPRMRLLRGLMQQLV